MSSDSSHRLFVLQTSPFSIFRTQLFHHLSKPFNRIVPTIQTAKYIPDISDAHQLQFYNSKFFVHAYDAHIGSHKFPSITIIAEKLMRTLSHTNMAEHWQTILRVGKENGYQLGEEQFDPCPQRGQESVQLSTERHLRWVHQVLHDSNQSPCTDCCRYLIKHNQNVSVVQKPKLITHLHTESPTTSHASFRLQWIVLNRQFLMTVCAI